MTTRRYRTYRKWDTWEGWPIGWVVEDTQPDPDNLYFKMTRRKPTYGPYTANHANYLARKWNKQHETTN